MPDWNSQQASFPAEVELVLRPRLFNESDLNNDPRADLINNGEFYLNKTNITAVLLMELHRDSSIGSWKLNL